MTDRRTDRIVISILRDKSIQVTKSLFIIIIYVNTAIYLYKKPVIGDNETEKNDGTNADK